MSHIVVGYLTDIRQIFTCEYPISNIKLTSVWLKVSPFNESENSNGVKVKPLIYQNNCLEKNKGRPIKVNPLNDVKSCNEDKISPDKESDYMENFKPFISEGVMSLVGNESSSQKVNLVPHVRQCNAPYR